jgi:hypothetical protein
VGVFEIANNVATIADALRETGHSVETHIITEGHHRFYGSNRYDHEIPYWSGGRIDRLRFSLHLAATFVRALLRCRAFVYVWHLSFLPKQLDFLVLRLLRKPVIVFYCGDDIRYRPTQVEIDRLLTDLPPFRPADEDEERRYRASGRTFAQAYWSTKIAEKTRCSVVATRDSATFQGAEYSLFRFPQRELTTEPKAASPDPLIIHAPSDRLVKGTRYVEEAIARLRGEGLRFRFELLEGVPNDELLTRMQEADIVIDQPGVWIARFAAEALASSCVVVGGNQPVYNGWAEPSPVVQFPPDGGRLADALRPLIADVDARTELMRLSHRFWRDHYSYPAFAEFLSDVMAGRARPLPPLPDHRKLALRFAESPRHRAAIRLFW